MADKAPRGGRGRPRHDDPPARLDTTLPQSVKRLLESMVDSSGQTQSEILVEAIRLLANQRKME